MGEYFQEYMIISKSSSGKHALTIVHFMENKQNFNYIFSKVLERSIDSSSLQFGCMQSLEKTCYSFE